MVCSPSASRTWASPRCASTIARSHSSDQIWLSPRESPSRSASAPLPTLPMIVVCRPASRVTLIGASCTYRWTGSAPSAAMLSPATRPLQQRGVPEHLQLAVPGDGVGRLGDVAGGVDVGVAGAQVLVHEDPALAREPGRARELDARPHADGGGDEVAADHVAVAGLHGRHPAAPSADGGQVGERVDLHALAAQRQLDDARLRLGEHVAPVAVLAHEVVHVDAAGPRPSTISRAVMPPPTTTADLGLAAAPRRCRARRPCRRA